MPMLGIRMVKCMGKRNDFMLYPGGKSKALTLSYDDGVVQDRRLVKLLDKYGIKCTFNLNAGILGFQGDAEISGRKTDISKVASGELPLLYKNHEIGGHGLHHSFLQNVGTALAMYEIIEDRRQLEEISGRMVRFFAYPFGTFNSKVKDILSLAGYTGARTVVSTHTFDIPIDFMEWNPTCHHNDPELMKLAEKFCTERMFGSGLFYLWGHTYEFDADDNWQVIEEFLSYFSSFSDDIWFAGNAEVADYINAFRQLVYSADGSMLYNPTALDLWLQIGFEPFLIRAGETVKVQETGE